MVRRVFGDVVREEWRVVQVSDAIKRVVEVLFPTYHIRPLTGDREIVSRRQPPPTLHQIRERELERSREELGTRTYGFYGTVHSTEHLSVEVDQQGQVVAVWFRCQALPFKQSPANTARSTEMNRMYGDGSTMPRLIAVEVIDR